MALQMNERSLPKGSMFGAKDLYWGRAPLVCARIRKLEVMDNISLLNELFFAHVRLRMTLRTTMSLKMIECLLLKNTTCRAPDLPFMSSPGIFAYVFILAIMDGVSPIDRLLMS